MSNYSERDIKAILSRAAELQERSRIKQADEKETSLSLEEIEQIAREVGVSTDFVREAALEYEGIPVKEPLFLDTGRSFEIEAIGFAKGELDKRTWAELRSIIEYEFNMPGKVRRRPDGIVWEAQPQGVAKVLETHKSIRVEVNSAKGRSTIRIKKSLKTYNKIFLLPAFLFWVLSVFLMAVTLMDEELAALFFAMISAFAGEFFRRWNKRKKEKSRQHLKDTVEQLQAIMTRRFHAAALNDMIEKPSIEIEADDNQVLDEIEIKDSIRSKERS